MKPETLSWSEFATAEVRSQLQSWENEWGNKPPPRPDFGDRPEMPWGTSKIRKASARGEAGFGRPSVTRKKKGKTFGKNKGKK